MKTVFKMCAAIIICLITIISCTRNPVDRKIDEIDVLCKKFEKIVKKDDPLLKDMQELQEDYTALQQLLLTSDINDKELTEKQKSRLLKIATRVQDVVRSANFQRLQNQTRQFNLNY